MYIKLWALTAVIIATIIGAYGALFFKKSSGSFKFDLSLLKNYNLIIGFVLYGISSLFYMASLKGGDLSILYPLVSLSYIWILLLSHKYLSEKITTNKIIGIALIIVGIVVINL